MSLGEVVPADAEWQTVLDADEERLDVATFVGADGSDNRFAVYEQLGTSVPYYWVIDGGELPADGGLDENVRSRCRVDETSVLCRIDGVLTAEDVVLMERGKSVPIPYDRFHFYFADDRPGASWAHPCRYIFVAEDLSSFTVLYRRWSPLLRCKASSVELPLAVVGSSRRQGAASLEKVTASVYDYAKRLEANAISYAAGDASKSYFVLISGGQMPTKNGIRFWSDAAMMYATLTKKYKVMKSHISVFMSDGTSTSKDANLAGDYDAVLVDSPRDLDGDGVDDVTGAATKSNIKSCFSSLRSSLSSSDQLFVFITSHGGPDGVAGLYNYDCVACLFDANGTTEFRDDELADWTRGFACPVAFAIETCYAGGFIDDITASANRAIATACNHYESSWGVGGGGAWVGGVSGKTSAYNRWAAPLVAAFRGYRPMPYDGGGYPYVDSGTSVNADVDDDGLVSFVEAANYAKSNDTRALTGDEHPQYGESASGVGARFFLTKATSVPPSPPANDNFANATRISGTSGSATGTNVAATYQPGEPLYRFRSAATNSVWWTWTAPARGTVTFSTAGSSFDTVMGIYHGSSLSSLVADAQDDDSDGIGSPSVCTFTATSGVTYFIAVSGYGASEKGSISLSWNMPNPILTTYTIRFHRNYQTSDTSTKDQSMEAGESKGLLWMDSQLGWTRSGYNFVGWAESATATTAKWANGATVRDLASAGSVKHLYAVWKAKSVVTTYKVRLHRNFSASDAPYREQTFTTGTAQRLLWMDSQIGWSRDGYVFAGWAETASATTAKWANGATVRDLASAGSVKHLYAVWKAKSVVTTYKVRLHRNFSASDAPYREQTFTTGTAQRLLWMDSQIGWSRDGYTFAGWAETASATTAKWANGATVSKLTTEGKTKHLYAVWMPNGGFPPYTVRFHYNVDSSSPTKDQTFQVGVAQNLLWKDSQLKWSRSGYEFLGWATASSSGFAKYVNGQKVTDLAAPGKTIHLYAVWYGGHSYRVVYHRNYTSSDTTTANHRFWNGESSQLAWKDSGLGWANPSGKTFLGWAETAGATTAKYANGATVSKLTTEGKTKHLYAVWAVKKAATAAMAGTGTNGTYVTEGTAGTPDAGLGAATYAALALIDGVPVPITVYVYADGLAWARIDDEIFIGTVGEDGAGELLGAGGAVAIVPL